MNRKPYSILIVDDHPLFRKGAADLIGMADDLVVAGEAESGKQGVALAKHLRPDLILLDLNMKDMDGLTALKAIKAEGLESRVIMLTVSDDEEDVAKALQTGADGYLLKDLEPEEILDNLKKAAAGRIVLSDKITRLLVHRVNAPDGKRQDGIRDLSEREDEALRYLTLGLSNKLIGREMGISEATVKVYVKNILRKLGFTSRTEAAVWAAENGYSMENRQNINSRPE